MEKTEVHDLLYAFAHRFLPNMTLKGSPDMADLLSDSYRLGTNEPLKKVFYEVIDKERTVEFSGNELKVKEYFKEGLQDTYIIQFPTPTSPTGALYVAIVDSDYMQYFTLELTSEGGYVMGSYYLNKDDEVVRRFWGYKGKADMDSFYKEVMSKLDETTKVIVDEHIAHENKPKVRSIWLEWQLYLMIISYYFLHSYIRYVMYGQTVNPGLLHIALVTLVYGLYWHESKQVTVKKFGMTIIWLILGNIGLGILAFTFSFMLGFISAFI